MAAVVITKLDMQGHDLFTYYGSLESFTPGHIVVRALWDRLPPILVGPLQIETNDVFLEHFYQQYWFNVFQVHSAGGELKGWYCNIAETVTLSESLIRWRDLALDLVVLPDGRQEVLDEDEFAALAIDPEQRRLARAALDELSQWASDRRGPFTLLTRQPAVR